MQMSGLTMMIACVAVLCILGSGCSEREEKKPAPVKSSSDAAPAPVRIKLTFPHVIPISRETPHHVGNFDQKLSAMVSRKNEAGALVFGPYVELDQAQYRVKFKLKTSGNPDQIVGKVDVNAFSDAQPDNPIAEKEVRHTKEEQKLELDFSSTAERKYEFRVWVNGSGILSVKEITLDRNS
jgi:hypothetical protein